MMSPPYESCFKQCYSLQQHQLEKNNIEINAARIATSFLLGLDSAILKLLKK